MTFKFSQRSEKHLTGVHPDLVKVVRLALTLAKQDFSVIEGVRTLERQKELVAKGASKTLNSRHLTGHAVDLVPYPVNWDKWSEFKQLADTVKQAAKQLNVPIVWGGDWTSFKDGPHFELDRAVFDILPALKDGDSY
ncbi:M15 family metallopeptidase [Lonepinella koalarum]|uniref:M15 family metallopeptidase n=1 Tax=Lonepinella koalarum TaxID=53417 RepID=UPI003F6E4295